MNPCFGYLDQEDAFKMYLTVEDVFPGKVTIVDLGNKVITFRSPSHIQSICDAMEIPHIGTKNTK